MYTYKTGGVVVTDGLGISVSLKYRVSLHNLILQASLYVEEGQEKGGGSKGK